MEKLFINLSNHPSAKWSAKQMDAAREIADTVVDMPFPNVDPYASEREIYDMAYKLVCDIYAKAEDEEVYEGDVTVCIAGEFSLVIAFVVECMSEVVLFQVVVATSERNTVLNDDGTKTVRFDFVRFRRVS